VNDEATGYNKEWNILQRLAEVQRRIGYIQKTKGGDLKYSIVSHDVVTGQVRPKMVAAGVLYYPYEIEVLGQTVVHSKTKFGERIEHRCEVHLICRFVNVDDPADFIDVHGLGHGIDGGDKGPGKAISYAVKYCLLKALGLETGDADESEYDQEERETFAPEELTIRDFEDKVALSTTSEALRKLAAAFKDKMTTIASDKKWAARVKRAQADWQARMAQVKKAEAEAGNGKGKPAEEEEEADDTTSEAAEEDEEFPGDKPQPGTKARAEYDKAQRAKARKTKAHPASGD
jgi:hypothetical protein